MVSTPAKLRRATADLSVLTNPLTNDLLPIVVDGEGDGKGGSSRDTEAARVKQIVSTLAVRLLFADDQSSDSTHPTFVVLNPKRNGGLSVTHWPSTSLIRRWWQAFNLGWRERITTITHTHPASPGRGHRRGPHYSLLRAGARSMAGPAKRENRPAPAVSRLDHPCPCLQPFSGAATLGAACDQSDQHGLWLSERQQFGRSSGSGTAARPTSCD